MFKCFHHCVSKLFSLKNLSYFSTYIFIPYYIDFSTRFIFIKPHHFTFQKLQLFLINFLRLRYARKLFPTISTPYCNNININLYTNYYINYYITIILNIVSLQRLQSNKIQNVALSLFEHRIFY